MISEVKFRIRQFPVRSTYCASSTILPPYTTGFHRRAHGAVWVYTCVCASLHIWVASFPKCLWGGIFTFSSGEGHGLERRRELSLSNLKKTMQPLRGEDKTEPASAPRCTGTEREAVDKRLEQRNFDWIQKENFFSIRMIKTLEQVAQSCCGISITELKTDLYVWLSNLI